MLIMSLTTFLAYPFLSGDDRKQVSPVAYSQEDDSDEDEMYYEDDEFSDEDEPVRMDEDDDYRENNYNNGSNPNQPMTPSNPGQPDQQLRRQNDPNTDRQMNGEVNY